MRVVVVRIALMISAIVVGGIGSAYAAGNVVPTSKAGQASQAITVNNLKPPHCAHLTLTATLVGTGANIAGGTASELILGTTAAETIKGGGGDDCILGGGGNDTLEGDAGTDVCIGGNGNDKIASNSGCETVVQDG